MFNKFINLINSTSICNIRLREGKILTLTFRRSFTPLIFLQKGKQV